MTLTVMLAWPASILLILASIAPFVPRREWWFRVFDFPLLQLSCLGVLTLCLWVPAYTGSSGENLIVVMVLVCVVWHLVRILPFTPVHSKEVLVSPETTEARRIAVMVSNVLMTNEDTDTLVRLVRERDPDILLTLESDSRWEQALAQLEETRPHVIRCPQDNLYGMHLYSRLELLEPRIDFLIEEDVPSIDTGVRLRSGEVIKLHCLHPAPPSPTENEQSIERDAELITIARRVKAQDSPTIVTGDLNDVAWSKTTRLFRRISGLLDPRVGRGLFNTFHAKYWFLRWPLDHLFHTSDFSLVELQRLGDIGSDHFPIFCRLQYSPAAAPKQHPEPPDKLDQKAAEQTLHEFNQQSSGGSAGGT